MTDLPNVSYLKNDLNFIGDFKGTIITYVPPGGQLTGVLGKLDGSTGGLLSRIRGSEAFGKLSAGSAMMVSLPHGLSARSIVISKLGNQAIPALARRAGATAISKPVPGEILAILPRRRASYEYMAGLVLRSYKFVDYKTTEKERKVTESVDVMTSSPSGFRDQMRERLAVAEGIYFARDLVNEPSNRLTTEELASRLLELADLGITCRVIEEDEMAEMGMNALLGVGQGSASPSKTVIMKWNGGGSRRLSIVGKGVVFDTGGISLKPSAGMEKMTMDMGGAATVAGVMKTLALRGAAADVVGIVGLVENMPGSRAQRPGDIVKSMKGDTIEVINTDAEGRLVLADLLWCTQTRHKPEAIIDLATLTGAIIVGLGNEKAGIFSNHNSFCKDYLRAANSEGEGAWHMPLGAAYHKLLRSNLADCKNIGGRGAGAITAACFLQRFVKKEVHWIHMDIAGVAATDSPGALHPKGASGWGVASIDRLIRNKFES